MDSQILMLVLAFLTTFATVIIYIVGIKGETRVIRNDLKHAENVCNHLIDEGKNLKLIHGQFQVIQANMGSSIVRIETKQDSMIEHISEIKDILKK